MAYGYDPFEGLVLPQVGSPRQQYGAPKRQAPTPSYAPAGQPQPTIYRYDPNARPAKPTEPDPTIYPWDPRGWHPNNPKVTPQPTIYPWDPNVPRPQPPRPAQPGNGAAYARPNMDRFGPRPQY